VCQLQFTRLFTPKIDELQQVIFPVYEWSVQAMAPLTAANTVKSTASASSSTTTATAANTAAASTTLQPSHKLATADNM
jgi:hypothetical protein